MAGRWRGVERIERGRGEDRGDGHEGEGIAEGGERKRERVVENKIKINLSNNVVSFCDLTK